MEAIRHHQVQMQQLQQQQAQMQQQQQAQQPQVALQTAGIERQSQQQHLNMRGFDEYRNDLGRRRPKSKIGRGKMKTAVPRMNGDLAELVNAAEAGEMISKPDFSDTFLIRVIPGIFSTRLMRSNNSGNF